MNGPSDKTIIGGLVFIQEYEERDPPWIFKEAMACWNPSFARNPDFRDLFLDLCWNQVWHLEQIPLKVQEQVAQAWPEAFECLVGIDEEGGDEIPYQPGYRVSQKALDIYWNTIENNKRKVPKYRRFLRAVEEAQLELKRKLIQ